MLDHRSLMEEGKNVLMLISEFITLASFSL